MTIIEEGMGEDSPSMVMPNLVIGIDATRNRSGGAVAHLKGVISGSDPRDFGIKKVHLWAYDGLLEQIDNQPWLVKHNVPVTREGIAKQLWWQYSKLPRLLDRFGCDIVFNTDAGSVCPTPRAVTLSQDMLSFESGERQRYGLSKARLRLEVLKIVQARRLKHSRLAIFLTEYARKTIESQIGTISRSVVIPHGIDDKFRRIAIKRRAWPIKNPIRCLYVSNIAPYKHQWHVVEAIASLREKGYAVKLVLIGGGKGSSMNRLNRALTQFDPQGLFVTLKGFVPNDEILRYLSWSDLFIFASSCENLPITLLEAMASGIPICSSNRGPMPEILGKEGCYFDPEIPSSIANAVQSMFDNEEMRCSKVVHSLQRSKFYTWERCSSKTWKSLALACRN